MKDKVKLSYNQWASIRNYKKMHWKERACCFFRLTKVNNTFRVDARVYLLAYIILFIPTVLLTFFACVWDGGLRTFELPTRWVIGSYIYPKCYAYDLCETLWDKKYGT